MVKRKHSKKKNFLLPVLLLAVLVVGGFMVFTGDDLSASLTGRFFMRANYTQRTASSFVVYNCSQDDYNGVIPEGNVPGSAKVYVTDLRGPVYYVDNCATASMLNEYGCDFNPKVLKSYSLLCSFGCKTDSNGVGYCG